MDNGYSDTKSIFQQIDWEKFFNMMEVIGKELDSRKARFDKSDIIEQAIEAMSNSKFKWVDEKGWDHEYQD